MGRDGDQQEAWQPPGTLMDPLRTHATNPDPTAHQL
jgi:hypothetical protein